MKMQAKSTILAFDTSAANCAAALLRDRQLVASRHEETGRGQAERLFPMLEEVLAEAGLWWSDLDAIGVGIGPGNFTGIRIAVSAARGLSLSMGIPAIGVSVFEALAFGSNGTVIASAAAPRGQVYAAVVGHAGAGPVLGDPLNVDLELPARERPVCIGEAADTFANRFSGSVADPAYPLAEAIARVALERADGAGHGRPSPLYIRSADAAPASDPPPVILP